MLNRYVDILVSLSLTHFENDDISIALSPLGLQLAG